MVKASFCLFLVTAIIVGCQSSDNEAGSPVSGQGGWAASGAGTGGGGWNTSGTTGAGGVSGASSSNGGSGGTGTGGVSGDSSSGNGGGGGSSGAGTGGSVTDRMDASNGDGATTLPDAGTDAFVALPDAGADASVTPPDGSWWKPVAGLTWQWQIGGGRIDPNLAVDVFDIDWEESASTVQQLHQAGKKVICYISVGSWENWRPDADSFPDEVLGNNYPGWPGERFVDIRAQALRDIMAARMEVCKTKGFDAVEPDNMDVFGNNSGFPLTRSDGIDYALWLADECHNRGMAIVQKNASEITSSIHSVYDGALTESCYSGGNWCSDMQPYIDANKPVFACEYNSGIFSAACAWGEPLKYSFILKSMDLGAPVTFCD